MQLTDFHTLKPDAKSIIVIRYNKDVSPDIKERVKNILLVGSDNTASGLTYFGNNMFGCDGPVPAVINLLMLDEQLPNVTQYFREISLLRVTDIDNLAPVFE
jgi:hypothetical protein